MNHSYRQDKGTAFDLSTTSEWVVPMNGDNVATVIAKRFGPWSTAVMTVRKSLDGVNPIALSTATTIGPPSGATVFAVGMSPSNDINVGGFNFLHVRVTTTEASASCDLDAFTNRV